MRKFYKKKKNPKKFQFGEMPFAFKRRERPLCWPLNLRVFITFSSVEWNADIGVAMATVANQDKNCWPRKMHRWTYLDVFGQICGAGRCSNSRRRAAKGRNNKWVHMFISLMWQCTLQPKKKIQRGAFFCACLRHFHWLRTQIRFNEIHRRC